MTKVEKQTKYLRTVHLRITGLHHLMIDVD